MAEPIGGEQSGQMGDRALSTTDAEPKGPRTAITLLPSFVPLAAPLTILMTGMLYLAGWIFQRTFLDHFGLSSAMFEFTIQDMLAQGYFPVVIGTIVISLFLSALWILSSISHNPKRRLLDGLSRSYAVFVTAVILLSYGYIAGERMANAKAIDLAKDVEGGCRLECFRYVVGTTIFTGRLIAQDKTRSAIYTRSGVIMIKNDALTRVIPTKQLSKEEVPPPIRGVPYPPQRP